MISMNNQDLLKAILRSDLKSFVTKVFFDVSPSAQYLDNWHIDLICQELAQMINGQETRLIINIPPRYLKSIICSVALPAFILGHNPQSSIICVSYSDDLAAKHANDCRRIITSQWYQELFPETVLSSNKKSTSDFETTKGGGRFSTSISGTLTGRGADWIIIDDPIKPTDAMSDNIRDKVNDWYRSTLYSRLNNKAEGKIILIMQRLHENDMTGFLLESDKKFKLIKLPVIAEEDETWILKNQFTQTTRTIERHPGDLLHPQRENLETIKELQDSLGEFAFAGQYQQNPVPQSGGMVKKDWMYFYNELPAFKQIILSWDTASKEGFDNAYSAYVLLGVDYNRKYYLIEANRYRLNFPELVKTVDRMNDQCIDLFKQKPYILIEDASSGTQLIQVLRGEYGLSPHAIRAEQNKISRMQAVSLAIEQQRLLFPNQAGIWYQTFEKELLTFPKSRFKDQCDALSQAVCFLSSEIQNPQIKPYIATGNHFYTSGHRSTYKVHPMRDPRKLRH